MPLAYKNVVRDAQSSHVPTSTWPEFKANPSESASLMGHKAKTPIIAGSICGGLMGLAWIIGFSIYFYKRWRKKKLRRIGAVPQGEVLKKPEEKFIIPPDPAIVLGHRAPGENAFLDGTSRQNSSRKFTRSKSQNSTPLLDASNEKSTNEEHILSAQTPTTGPPPMPPNPVRISSEMIVPAKF